MKRFAILLALVLFLSTSRVVVWADNATEATEIETSETQTEETETETEKVEPETETEEAETETEEPETETEEPETETEEPETETEEPETETEEPETETEELETETEELETETEEPETETEEPETETEEPETQTPETEATPPEQESEPALVIVIDPGHDSKHSGASENGIVEENTVLKIGHYLKEELSKYQNVKVYMIREGKECAFPGTSSAKLCNEARVAYAKSVGADVIVSLHLNSFTNSRAKGSLILVQNNNYDAKVGKASQTLGQKILKGLVALGLSDGGLVKKNSEASDGYYPDGSRADYYQILKLAKLAHVPAVIVEHAYVSSPSDVAKVLATENGLKALALKDAQGIVDYYGLSLKKGCVAGELPDLQNVPATQPKPTPEPEEETKPEQNSKPEQKPTQESETEPEISSETEIDLETEKETETEIATEMETQVSEESESQLMQEESESELINEDTSDDATVDGEAKEFPRDTVVGIVGVFVAIGITALAFYQKKRNTVYKKDEE